MNYESKSKLNLGRINKATMLRMQNLRDLLQFIKDNPNITVDVAHKKFKWSPSKCSKSLRSLVTCGLTRISGQAPNINGKSFCFTYSATTHTEADIERELPLGLETAGYDNMAQNLKMSEDRKAQQAWPDGQAQRYYLDTYLMGSGVAPSLTFKQRSQHGL